MTRKDYKLIAAALLEARSFTPATCAAADFNCGVATATRRLVERLQTDNPNFDRVRFLKAAGMQP
jgi:hypothetical protein